MNRIEDPDLKLDQLPQPYKLINKVIDDIIKGKHILKLDKS